MGFELGRVLSNPLISLKLSLRWRLEKGWLAAWRSSPLRPRILPIEPDAITRAERCCLGAELASNVLGARGATQVGPRVPLPPDAPRQ